MRRGQAGLHEKGASGAVIHVALLSAATNLLLLALPLYMLQVYDRVLAANSINTLVYISIIVTAALAVLGVIEFARAQYANRVAAQLDKLAGADLLSSR